MNKRHKHTICASSVSQTPKLCSEHYTYSTSAPFVPCAMSKVIFKHHLRMLQHVIANCCNHTWNSTLLIVNAGRHILVHTTSPGISGDPVGQQMESPVNPSVWEMLIMKCMHNQTPVLCVTLLEEHGTVQFQHMWIDKVFQHLEIAAGCHSHFDKQKGFDQMIVQQATSYINSGTVTDVLYCSIRLF